MLTDIKSFIDPTTFYQKLLEQVMKKSPELIITLISQEPGTQEQFLLELMSDRLSQLLRGPVAHEADIESPEDTENENIIDMHDNDLFLKDYEYLVNKNNQLASALGACDCWGDNSECSVCQGEGSPGWITPEVRAYSQYIRPAMQRLHHR